MPLFEAFVTFQLLTAARRGEALNLTWENVDFDECNAYLLDTKNGKPSLQAFSGHRDTRMLLRYALPCTKQLADRLDQAFATTAFRTDTTLVHRGRRRIRTGSGLSLAAIVGDFDAQSASAPVHISDAGANNVLPFRRAQVQ